MKKQNEIKELVQRLKPGFLLISETHIKHERNPPPTKGYQAIHGTMHNRRFGGLAIYVHDSINFTIIKPHMRHTEALAMKSGDVTIVCGYRTPSNQIVDHQDLDEIFREGKIILAGDMNAKSTTWGCEVTDTAGRRLENFLEENGYIICAPDAPTYIPSNVAIRQSILDIIVSRDTRSAIDLLNKFRSQPSNLQNFNPNIF